MTEIAKYRAYGLNNFKKIPQVTQYLTEEQIFEIEVVGNVLPFKTNNYVVDELIEWENVPNDPIFILTFPQKTMLTPEHYAKMADALKSGLSKTELKAVANDIRMDLNPHPAGQMEYNVPMIEGTKLTGIQHKYRETMLFFPQAGQTCHAYCTFCFRWAQFVGIDDLKFAMKEADLMVKYVKAHPEITDILFTGGDPMVMKAKKFRPYIEQILENKPENLKTIRIGTKALGYWPYRFTTDDDAAEMIEIFQMITDAGLNLSIMGHFNHTAELKTQALKDAVDAIHSTGARIRTQSPIMTNINDSAEVWSDMWKQQVQLGMIPYYMFLARDTGAQDYFSIPLDKAQQIFSKAYSQVSGICRTVKGPSMSAEPGKVHVVGTTEVNGEKVFVLNFLQGRNPEWVGKPFFAKYDPKAIWLDDLKPAFGEEKFFYEEDYERIKLEKKAKFEAAQAELN